MRAEAAPAGAVREEAAEPLTLEQLVDTYGNGVLHLAYLQVKDRQLAEDIFQEVFTRVYLNLHKFRGEASPRTWLYRITVNLCRDKLRAPALRRVLLFGEDLVAAPGLETDDAAAEALARVDKAKLLDAVMDLPLEYKEVVLLYYYEDLEVREVGRVLGLLEGTVRSRLHRARLRLKAMLAEGGFGDDAE